MSRLPIRLRLTLAFVVVIAVVLSATGAFLYLRFQAELDTSLDHGLRARADEVSALVEADPSALADASGSRLLESDETFAQVIGPAGELIGGTPQLEGQITLTPAQLARARRGPLFVDRGPPTGFDAQVRVLARPVGEGERSLVVVVGASRDDRNEALETLRTQLLTGGPIALLLASLAGYALASGALGPVESIRRRAADISRLDTGQRLPVPPARDELAQLADTLNEMLDRLESSAERERGFVANASHELRTPLALLKGELELALREGRSPEELRAAIESAAEESDRLIQLSEDLLVLARSDQGRLTIRPAELDVDELLQRVKRRFGTRADQSRRTLSVEADGNPRVVGDPLRLEQALANLVDNALRHGAGEIRLEARDRDGMLELHVLDDGPGFPDEFLASAFERFARADQARSRGGAGLGLAIVETIAAAHGGSANARNRDGHGADVWISVPR